MHDYAGGLADIAARRVRFIGDADKRIAEDYLRILRFFRFHAAYGEGALDPEGLAACIAARAGLDRLSRERVRMEAFKLVVAKHAVPTLATMTEAGLLEQVLGGVPLLASFASMAKLEAAFALAPDAVGRLGALAVSVAEDAERLRDGTARQCGIRAAGFHGGRLVADFTAMGRRGGAGAALSPRPRALRRSRAAGLDALARGADPSWRALVTLPARWSAPTFPLKAADFMARGVRRVLGSARCCARPRRPGSPPAFPTTRLRSRRSPNRRWLRRNNARGSPPGPRLVPLSGATRSLPIRHYIAIVRRVMSSVRRPADIAPPLGQGARGPRKPARWLPARDLRAAARGRAREAREMFRRFPRRPT